MTDLTHIEQIITRALLEGCDNHKTRAQIARETARQVMGAAPRQNDFLRRMAIFFDRDATAGPFCAEDGDGGFVAAAERMAREIDRLRATLSAEVERLRGERDAAIMEVSRQAAARGRAEGALATSGTAGVVEGWRARAEAAEAEVERLRNEADGEFVAAAVRVMRANPGFDHRDYQDGITADDFEMFFTEDMNEAWRLHEKERARAEAAEARVKRLEEVLERIVDEFLCTIQQYDRNGPSYTHKDGTETFDVCVILDRRYLIEQALSALSHTKEA